MKLVINKPRIEKNRLISTIEFDQGKKYDLFFEVEQEYIQYLSEDNANSFLIALLPFVVKHNYDVEVESSISSQLYFQLTNFLLPLLCSEFKKKNINIKCNLTNEKTNGKAVGASISCGVDSFYTLYKNIDNKDPEYNITHLCFFNAGSNGEFGGDEAYNLYLKRVNHVSEFCKENNFKLVTINSNINELIKMNHEKRHTFTTLACVYSLEKLFGKYYFASGLGFNGSHISEEDTAFYDILNVHCLSNENIEFYCSGMETTRMKKIEYISSYEQTYNWLNVCIGDEWENCCKCKKCIRTMTALESIGKLQKYEKVFDLEYYFKNRNKIISNLLKGSRNKLQKEFCIEIIDSYKKNNIKFSIFSYLLSFIPSLEDIKIIGKKILPKKLYIKVRNAVKKDELEKINDGWMD